ncbi:MAG: hypothetical protein ACRDOG_00240, partial [Gaiellaceae bacterium]
RKAAGVFAIRFAAAPLVLLACGAALGADIPAAFVLGAAMPCAFHLLVLARVFDVRPQLVRLLVVGTRSRPASLSSPCPPSCTDRRPSRRYMPASDPRSRGARALPRPTKAF